MRLYIQPKMNNDDATPMDSTITALSPLFVKGKGPLPIKQSCDTNEDYCILVDIYMGLNRETIGERMGLSLFEVDHKIKQIAYKHFTHTDSTTEEIINETGLSKREMNDVIHVYGKITKYQTELNELYSLYPIADTNGSQFKRSFSELDLTTIERNLNDRFDILNIRIDDLYKRLEDAISDCNKI